MNEFNLIQSGYVERFDIEQREEWERIRWQTFVLMQPQVKANSLQKPQSLITFPWEEKEKSKIPSKEIFDKLFPKTI